MPASLNLLGAVVGAVFLFWGIASGTAEPWASTGAIWRDMLLAEALVIFIICKLIDRSECDSGNYY